MKKIISGNSKNTFNGLPSTSHAKKGKIVFNQTALVKFETSFYKLIYKKIKLVSKIKSIDEKINRLNSKLMGYIG